MVLHHNFMVCICARHTEVGYSPAIINTTITTTTFTTEETESGEVKTTETVTTVTETTADEDKPDDSSEKQHDGRPTRKLWSRLIRNFNNGLVWILMKLLWGVSRLVI